MYPKTAFILGAGASRHANAPIMTDFLQKALGLINDLEATDKELARAFHRVFTYQAKNDGIEHLLGVNFTNIEDLFSILDLEATVSSSLRSLRRDLIDLIIHTIERCRVQEQPHDFLMPAQPNATATVRLTPMEALAVLAANRYCDRPPNIAPANSIVTLNYDTILEEAVQQTPPLSIDYGIAELSPPPARDARARLQLFKLHGSINWRACTECEGIQCVPTNTQVASCNKCGKDTETLIVPPSWNKGRTGRLQRVWELAFGELRIAQQWVFIGTSLPTTDAYLRYLFAVAFRQNENLRQVIIVDPGKAENLQALFARKAHRIKVTPIHLSLVEALGDGRTSPLAKELGCVVADPQTPMKW